jgi:hypothetical protein
LNDTTHPWAPFSGAGEDAPVAPANPWTIVGTPNAGTANPGNDPSGLTDIVWPTWFNSTQEAAVQLVNANANGTALPSPTGTTTTTTFLPAVQSAVAQGTAASRTWTITFVSAPALVVGQQVQLTGFTGGWNGARTVKAVIGNSIQLSGINSTTNSPNVVNAAVGKAVATAVGTTGTLTFTTDPGLQAGQFITLSGFTPTEWNGTYLVQTASPTTVTITVAAGLAAGFGGAVTTVNVPATDAGLTRSVIVQAETFPVLPFFQSYLAQYTEVRYTPISNIAAGTGAGRVQQVDVIVQSRAALQLSLTSKTLATRQIRSNVGTTGVFTGNNWLQAKVLADGSIQVNRVTGSTQNANGQNNGPDAATAIPLLTVAATTNGSPGIQGGFIGLQSHATTAVNFPRFDNFFGGNSL